MHWEISLDGLLEHGKRKTMERFGFRRRRLWSTGTGIRSREEGVTEKIEDNLGMMKRKLKLMTKAEVKVFG